MLREFWELHPDAEPSLRRWDRVARAAAWTDLQSVRSDFASADGVRVESGKTAVVFNIAGNKYRLITVIHYNTGTIFTRHVLTHAAYDREQWKHNL